MSKEVRATGANQIGQAVKLHATLAALIVEAASLARWSRPSSSFICW